MPKQCLRKLYLAFFCLTISATPAMAATQAEEAPEEEKSKTVHQMQNIVVTASGYEQDVKDAPASITVITREELEKRQFNNLADALRGVEGVSQIGGINGGFSIRGMDDDGVLILIDGKRQNTKGITIKHSPSSGLNNNWIPPVHAIERIEIIRGPMSTLYGSEALGGVINIITRKVGHEWHGAVSWDHVYNEEKDAGDTNQYDLYLAGPLVADKLGIQIWGFDKRIQPDKVKEAEAGGTVQGNYRTKRQSGTARLTYIPVEKHEIMLEASQETQHYWGYSNNAQVWSNAENEYQRDSYSLSYNADWKIFKSEANVYYDKAERMGPTEQIHPKVLNFVSDLKISAPIASHMLVAGGQYKDTEVKQGAGFYNTAAGSKTSFSSSMYEWSGYIEDEWAIFDKFSLVGGIRYDDNEKFGGHWSPRLYALFHVLPELTIKGGAAKGFKSPTAIQIDGSIGEPKGGGSGRMWGNPDLDPEETWNYEIGIHYTGEKISGSVTGFYTDYKNKIASSIGTFYDAGGNVITEPSTGGSWGTYFNYADAAAKGVEASVSYKFIDSLKTRLNYTYTDTEIKSGHVTVFGYSYAVEKGSPISSTPKHMVNLNVDWQALDSLGVFLTANYRGDETYISSWTTANSSVKKNTKDLLTFDLGFNWQATDHLSFSATAYNITDEVRTDDADNAYTYYEYGRRYWVKVACTF